MTLSMQDRRSRAQANASAWWTGKPFPRAPWGRPYFCDTCGAVIAAREGTSLVGTHLECRACTDRRFPLQAPPLRTPPRPPTSARYAAAPAPAAMPPTPPVWAAQVQAPPVQAPPVQAPPAPQVRQQLTPPPAQQAPPPPPPAPLREERQPERRPESKVGSTIWGHRKVLLVAALVLAAVIAGCTTWILTSGGSSGYKEETISSIFGQQTIRTKGSSAQLCSNGKWVPIQKNGSQITFPSGTRIAIGGKSCSNAGAGTPGLAVVGLIAAGVLEVVTLGLLAFAKITGGKRPIEPTPHPTQ